MLQMKEIMLQTRRGIEYKGKDGLMKIYKK